MCGGLPMGAHWSPLWSSLGRGVVFMGLIRESCKVYYACMRGNNKRSSDIHHKPQTRQVPKCSSSKQTDVTGLLKQTTPFRPYASWVTPVLSILWTSSFTILLEVGAGHGVSMTILTNFRSRVLRSLHMKF